MRGSKGAGSTNAAQLPIAVPQRDAHARGEGLRSVPGKERALAGCGACVLPRQQSGDGSCGRDDRSAPSNGHVAAKGESVCGALGVCAPEIRRRRTSAGAHRSETEFHWVVTLGAKKQQGEYALYVGRLSEEKGPQVLLKGWARLRAAYSAEDCWRRSIERGIEPRDCGREARRRGFVGPGRFSGDRWLIP